MPMDHPCWTCGRNVPPDAESCERCGAVLLTLCEECGSTESVYAERCSKCDAGLVPQRYRRRFPWRAVVAVVLLIGVAAAVTAVILHRRNPSRWQVIEDARAEYEAGKIRDATVRLRHLIERSPGNTDAHYLLALCRLKLNEVDAARHHATVALDHNPDLPGPRLVLAIIAYQEGEFALAQAEAERTLLHPGSLEKERNQARAHLLLGKIHSQGDLVDLRRASYHLRAAVQSPLIDDAEAWLLLAQIAGRYESAGATLAGEDGADHYLAKARDAANRTLDTSGRDPRANILLARIAFAGGKYEEARRRIVDVDEPDLATRTFLARISWRLGNGSDALRELSTLRDEAATPEQCLLVADAYRAIEQVDRARTLEQKALERYPENVWLVRREVRRLFDAGDATGARALAERSAAAQPESAVLLLVVVDILLAGNGDAAEAEKRLAAFGGGPNSEVTLRRAQLLLDTPDSDSRLADRLAEAERIIALDEPSTPDLFPVYRGHLLGKLALRRNRLNEAVRILSEVTRRVPSDAAVRRLLATAHFQRREYELQARELSSLLRLVGDRPELRLERAEAWLRAGFARRGREDVEQVLSDQPDHADGIILLARLQIAEDDGHLVRAIDTLTRAVDSASDPIAVLLFLARLRAEADDFAGAASDLARAERRARTPADHLAVTDARARIQSARDGTMSSAASRELWREFLRRNPDSVDGLLAYASRLVDAADGEAAAPWIDRALVRDPRSLPALRLRFETHLLGSVDRAAASALSERVREIAPDSVSDVYLRGRLALLDETFEEAVRLLDEAAERSPNDPRTAFYQALAHAGARSLPEASAALDRALEIEPRLKPARELRISVHIDWAAELLETNQASKAADLLLRSLEDDPANFHVRALLAKALYQAGYQENPSLFGRARTYCESLLADLDALGDEAPEGFREPSTQLLAAILMAQREWEAAAEAFERHLRLSPDDVQSLHGLGICRLRLDDPEAALTHLHRAHERAPDRFETLLVLLNTLTTAGRPEEAAALVRRRVEARPDDTTAHAVLGKVLYDSGQTEQAEAVFRAVLERDPDNLPATDWLLNLLAATDRPAEAVRLARSLHRRTTRSADAGVLLGHALLRTDRTSGEAARLFRAAIASETDREDLWLRALNLLLGILLRTDRAGEAATLEGAYSTWVRQRTAPLAGGPHTDAAAHAWYQLGRAHTRAELLSPAEACYGRAIEIRPDHVQALNNLADLIARTAKGLAEPRRTERLSDALPLARRATELRPGDPVPWNTFGVILLELDRADEALAPLSRSVRLAERPEVRSAEITARLMVDVARAQLAVGRRADARDTLKRALALAPKLAELPEAKQIALESR